MVTLLEYMHGDCWNICMVTLLEYRAMSMHVHVD